MSAVEALYIYDEHNNILFEQVYTGRPVTSSSLLPFYLAHPSPRPTLIHIPSTNPPTLLFSIIHDRLLLLSPTSAEIEPLLVVEFLHRVADALEEFLGAPLLASKIEASVDVVAQVVGEMCDAGLVCNTEPNALREVVEAPSWADNWFGGLGLSGPSSSAPGHALGSSISRTESPFRLGAVSATTSSAGSAIPWRKSNVRHTSNELYVDIIERLSVVHAPSGRPLSAVANGSIAFTAKISGVPDLVLQLTAPGGRTGILNVMELPCFHPCVRLSVWRERPGELSFIPPDGRFTLAGYECNLMPDIFTTTTASGKIPNPNLSLPAALSIRPSLGPYGEEFEIKLTTDPRATSRIGSSAPPSGPAKLGGAASRFVASTSAFNTGVNAASATPSVEDLVVTIPIPAGVRNVADLRASKGEAHHLATEGIVEWRIPNKDAPFLGTAGATLRCSLIGPAPATDGEDGDAAGELGLKTDTYDYDDRIGGSYQETTNGAKNVARSGNSTPRRGGQEASTEARDYKRVEVNSALMPKSASLSFSVKGWLASGIRVEGLMVNAKTSKGLGAGVTPYKGVKYHTVSKRGVEVRC